MMEAKHFKVGDKFQYVGKNYGPDLIGLEREVTVIEGKGLRHNFHFQTGNISATGSEVVLVERDGKRVKSIIEYPGLEIRVEYTNGCYETWSGDMEWHLSSYTHSNETHLKTYPTNWRLLYSADAPGITLTLDEALAKIKADHDFCSDFDRHVERAKKIAGKDGDLISVLKLVAVEQDYDYLGSELDALLTPVPAKKVKWPAGSIVQHRTNTLAFRQVRDDVFEGDTEFMTIPGLLYYVPDHQRVEITVVD